MKSYNTSTLLIRKINKKFSSEKLLHFIFSYTLRKHQYVIRHFFKYLHYLRKRFLPLSEDTHFWTINCSFMSDKSKYFGAVSKNRKLKGGNETMRREKRCSVFWSGFDCIMRYLTYGCLDCVCRSQLGTLCQKYRYSCLI